MPYRFISSTLLRNLENHIFQVAKDDPHILACLVKHIFTSLSNLWMSAWYYHIYPECIPSVRLQNLPWSETGLVSRQVLHPLSKLQNWIWSKTGRYKTGLVSNTKIEASLRATKPKPWQSNLTSDTVEIFIQNENAGLVPMQSRFRSRHKAGFGAAGLGTAQSWFWSRHKASFGAVSRPV